MGLILYLRSGATLAQESFSISKNGRLILKSLLNRKGAEAAKAE